MKNISKVEFLLLSSLEIQNIEYSSIVDGLSEVVDPICLPKFTVINKLALFCVETQFHRSCSCNIINFHLVFILLFISMYAI